MDKILVSACLMGDTVRYDGGHQQLLNSAIQRWCDEGRIVKICPEVAGGLPIPRPPAEQKIDSNLVVDVTGKDVTQAFNVGANAALALCRRFKIKYALLKESSPSCGSNTIYNGEFNQTKVTGEGVTTRLLRQNGVQVFSEQTLAMLVAIIDG